MGSANTLKRDDHWKNLVESADQRNVLFKVSKPYADFFGDSNLKSLEVKESGPEKLDAPVDDMDVDMPTDANASTVDPAQPDDNDWGDAGGEEAFYGDFGED